jgi:hypothetical protein
MATDPHELAMMIASNPGKLIAVDLGCMEIGDELIESDEVESICTAYAKLHARIAELEAIVGRLLRTKDGHTPVPGDKIYEIDPVGYIQGLTVRDYRKTTDSSAPDESYTHTSQCFFTREAAEEAREAALKGTPDAE